MLDDALFVASGFLFPDENAANAFLDNDSGLAGCEKIPESRGTSEAEKRPFLGASTSVSLVEPSGSLIDVCGVPRLNRLVFAGVAAFRDVLPGAAVAALLVCGVEPKPEKKLFVGADAVKGLLAGVFVASFSTGLPMLKRLFAGAGVLGV